jgi:cytochrome c-type biogenesis protein CcmH/NrfF
VNPRRAGAAIILVVLLCGALAGIWRSAQPDRPADPAHRLAAQLRCPACQGESVADSRSPIAAAMREVISTQLAQGRHPDEVRGYLVERYGPEVRAAPPARGPGLLLWLTPALLLLASVAAAIGGRRRAKPAGRAVPARRPRTAARAARTWNISAACLLVLVAGIALAAPRFTPAREAATPADPVPGQLTLARSLEEQGRYDAAAEVYRTALSQHPTDDVRLRLAFTLIRSGQAGEAERLANQVLAGRPDAPDALLILGLAQREAGSTAATTTLRRFLTLAPEHPAALEVRRLLKPE